MSAEVRPAAPEASPGGAGLASGLQPGQGRTAAAGAVRSTQWFVATLSWCWRHPVVTALEVLWRWMFGVALLWFVGRRVNALLLATTGGVYDWSLLGLDHITVVDPVGAAKKLALAASLLLPGALELTRRLLPGWLALWIVMSSLGRTLVLRKVDARLHARPGTLIVLQVLRMLVLVGAFVLWFLLVTAVGRNVVTAPITAGQEPNLLLYFAAAILLTLGLFTLWAVLSWALSLAPLIAMLDNVGVGPSLVRAFRPRGVGLQLAEVNLVLGIVKIALMVLALVFSATPLPFESVATTEFLLWWSAGVAVLYFVASDFFHVARLVTYLSLWQRQERDMISQR